MISEPSWAVG